MKATKHLLLFVLLAATLSSPAQWDLEQSVLREGSWYKIGVVDEGVHAIDAALLRSLGVEIGLIDPAHLRLYGNLEGVLPEANNQARYDDLTEVAIQVEGGDDGSFDEQDRILFYGQGPVKMRLGQMDTYSYERHPYTDTLYYFLRLDGDAEGLRVEERPVGEVDGESPITEFPDYWCHESEELSPYASGRVWYGDQITTQMGSKEFVFDMPYYVKNKPVRLYSRVLGRSPIDFNYRVSLNGVALVTDTIKHYQDHFYGRERTVDRMLTLDKEGFSVRYDLLSEEQSPQLFIDYFVVNYWRELVYQERELAFRLVPSQLADGQAEVQIRGVHSGVTCWEVTNPLTPVVQQMQLVSGNGTFGVLGAVEHRYHLFDHTEVKPVASAYRIPNQNLHALNTADYLLITKKLFLEQAEELAQFHREMDGMDCLVVDVDEIYNEFGTGVSDPTAVRDFIRMIYLRSGQKLRYVLMFGKGTHDYRDIKGQGNNFVPTYQIADNAWNQVESLCSDDYFGLMDGAEGNGCDGKVDLGVGRLPVTTERQAEDMVRKIKHYADRSVSRGPWLNHHLFMADNDIRSYIENTETLSRVLDTAAPFVTVQKLYVDSYPVVTTPSGKRIPGAHDALLDCFDAGFGIMSYTGHGGVSGLMNELVLSNSDILGLKNYDRLPFVHTATCEFSEFDNPLLVSAGELMILNPEGGAIAMLTTTRPTYISPNQSFSRSLHEFLYDLENMESLRFGDINRLTKAYPKYYRKDNICYVLFGDPALRFAYPSRRVGTQKINGVSSQEVVVPASGQVTVEGFVSGQHERIDTLFNGVVDVRVYDKKVQYTTLGALTQPQTYSYHHDILFEGKAEVAKGRFSVTFCVPSEINYGAGNARVSYYAYDTLREVTASGVSDALKVEGVSEGADQQGPEVNFYWDSPSFVSGDVVSRNGSLCADLFDESGIYHYNVSIGRNIMMQSDVSEFNNLLLNDRFEPALNDYRRGRVVLPVTDLGNGTHEFTLKVWDTQGNSTEKTIVLVIEEGVMMAQVYNFPNPFSEGTYFSLRHGDLTEALRVWVEIYDVLGRCVAGVSANTASEAGVVPPLYWDGCDYGGNHLGQGVYVYRLHLEDGQGKHKAVSGRMLIR